jgi:7-deoxyloganetin glucosyltransferase
MNPLFAHTLLSIDMGSIGHEKPHAVCIPYPAQGHVTPMLKLAKLLHADHGFHITFVNTHYNHSRLLKSGALSPHLSVPDFHFESIPDGLPAPPEGFEDATQVYDSKTNLL